MIFFPKNDAIKLIFGPMIDFYIVVEILSKSFKLCIFNELTGPKTSKKAQIRWLALAKIKL